MKRAILAVLITLGLAATTHADVFWYSIDGGIKIQLRGTLKRQGRAVFFTHPEFGRIILEQSNISDHEEMPTMKDVLTRKFNAVKSSQDADEIFEVSNECLRRGLLDMFYEGIDLVLNVDPQHEGALRVKRVKAMIDTPIEDSTKEEEHLINYVKNPKMKISRSAHYLLLHDTGEKPIHPSRKKSRAEERLELLETVYEAFMMRFWAAGVELTVPQERMQVVLFHEHSDYLAFSTSLSPSLSSTAGFYDPKTNIAFFFDQGTHDSYKSLKSLLEFYEEQVAVAERNGIPAGDAKRSAETLGLLVQVEQEKEDIEVVSHEGTHQLARNTGLQPRDILIPSWLSEGLATYFESPDEATWAGFGAVNETRLDWYREFAKRDRERSNIDYIVGDEIFDLAASHGATLHAYAQAWALTHFLMENHFEEFMEFYRRIGEMPPDIVLNSELINEVFDDVFSESKRSGLNRSWHSYMSSLETNDEFLRSMGR